MGAQKAFKKLFAKKMDPQDPADEYDTIVVESIVTKRKGDVLNQYAILKTDAYPSILQKSLVPRISGASNYRKAPGINCRSHDQIFTR